MHADVNECRHSHVFFLPTKFVQKQHSNTDVQSYILDQNSNLVRGECYWFGRSENLAFLLLIKTSWKITVMTTLCDVRSFDNCESSFHLFTTILI